MLKTKTAEEAYLLHLLDCALNDKAPMPFDGVQFDRLLKLADAQQVYNMVLGVLEKNDCLSPQEAAQWKNYRLSNLQKTILVDSERAAICIALEDLGIDYMFLKGLVIREYYPAPSMRQMGDNDILYDETRREDLLKMMKEHGFYLEGVSDASDDFSKYPVTIEFHRCLFNPGSYFTFSLNVWERAQRVEQSHRLLINKEDNYLYALAHTYKHYLFGGSSLRAVCDHFLLSKKEQYDMQYIASVLKEYHLEEFHRTLSGLCECIFGEKEPTSEEQALCDVILSQRATIENHPSFLPDIKDGKAKYIFARLFPNKQMMVWSYPVLETKPYLLPFYYLKRLATRSVHGRQKLKKELKRLKK